jgi:predicted TPR repeat methyltransferase
LWHREGDPDGAAIAYRHATKAAPQFAQGYANLALVLGKLGNAAGAIEAYRQAVTINPMAFGHALKLPI